jgi:4-diphosphocytidyl-2-C-methyl-D-erythritol kinase
VTASVTARAPGKVNIQLSVGAVRDDGFHPLASVFHAVAMSEEVTVAEGVPGSGIVIDQVSGLQAAEVPRDSTNLVWRAAERLATEVGRPSPDLEIAITKGVPVAGGMAGGSADCAAALVALNDLWGAPLGRDDLARVALDLGSDVPFSLMGGTALGLGRGELLSPLMVRGTFHWVFATATRGLSTPAVYAAFDRLVADRVVPEPQADAAVIAALIAGDAPGLARVLHNDLQEPALSLRPTLRDVLDAGVAAGALGGIVSGSGPTVAFLVADAASAARTHAAVAGMEQVRAAFTTTGPAPGARVIHRSG